MIESLDDVWLQKRTKFTAFCILNALSRVSKAELSKELGVEIRTLFTLPLTPPTYEIRHWVNEQKSLIRQMFGKSDLLPGVREALGSYCESVPRHSQDRREAEYADTRALIDKAVTQATVPVDVPRTLAIACEQSKTDLIRHLPVNAVFHDHSAQNLLLGIMFNSMKPRLKESAALALASVQNYDWMTLDWLKLNREFLGAPSNAWKSIVVVQCQMKLAGQCEGLSRFNDAVVEFRHNCGDKARFQAVPPSQLMFSDRDDWVNPKESRLKMGATSAASANRLRERLDVLAEVGSY